MDGYTAAPSEVYTEPELMRLVALATSRGGGQTILARISTTIPIASDNLA